jgi:cell division protein FtsQ
VIPNERLDQFGNLIVLVGPDAPAHGAELIDMLQTEPGLAAHVAAAVRVGGRRWNLHLDNNIDIALPEDDPAAGWRRLAQLERRDGILEREIQEVDLRLPDRLVVRTATEPPKPKGKKGRQGKAT